mmetsp:Transcript_34721/g.73256  ORF Transcript_34721/g.73256 Transcript_34721/m.73256 type:complete len:97 (-) Transcript_34721:466-756(-)
MTHTPQNHHAHPSLHHSHSYNSSLSSSFEKSCTTTTSSLPSLNNRFPSASMQTLPIHTLYPPNPYNALGVAVAVVGPSLSLGPPFDQSCVTRNMPS